MLPSGRGKLTGAGRSHWLVVDVRDRDHTSLLVCERNREGVSEAWCKPNADTDEAGPGWRAPRTPTPAGERKWRAWRATLGSKEGEKGGVGRGRKAKVKVKVGDEGESGKTALGLFTPRACEREPPREEPRAESSPAWRAVPRGGSARREG